MTTPAEEDRNMKKGQQKSISLAIVYDNNPYQDNCKTDWGFSCFIEGLEKSILFDTGGSGQILLDNMAKLSIDPGTVDGIFISHDHKDHTGGLVTFLEKNGEVDVWVPYFFPKPFKASLRKKAANVNETENFGKIYDRAYTTGVINGWIKEQSLLIETGEDLVLITGCAHPRIVNIVRTAKHLFKQNVRTIIGGFHLVGFEENIIKEIIDTLRNEGVTEAGPCHCSGEDARRLFAQAFGENYFDLGVGKKITIR